MYNAAETRITYGDKLTKLLDKHKVVHEDTIELDEYGKFKSMHYEVGGD